MTGMQSEYDYFRDKKDRVKKKEPKKWIRYKEALEIYPVSRKTLEKWARDCGAIHRIEDSILLDAELLEKYVESNKVPGGAW